MSHRILNFYINIFFFRSNVTVNDFVVKSLFTNNCFFKLISQNLDKKSYLAFENLNLILRHLNNNPFKLINFVIESNKRSSIFSK